MLYKKILLPCLILIYMMFEFYFHRIYMMFEFYFDRKKQTGTSTFIYTWTPRLKVSLKKKLQMLQLSLFT